jgi:hypothetical protein
LIALFEDVRVGQCVVDSDIRFHDMDFTDLICHGNLTPCVFWLRSILRSGYRSVATAISDGRMVTTGRPLMSAGVMIDVRFGSLADLVAAHPNVRFTPESGHR